MANKEEMPLNKRKQIAAAIEDCADSFGIVRPETVVEAARNKASILHDMFDWNDKSAAAKHRLDTARRIIREVKIEIVTTIDRIVVPYYTRDPDADAKEQGYISIASVPKRSDKAQRVMIDELTRIEAAISRARAICDVLGLGDHLDQLAANAARIRQLAQEAA